MLDKIEPSGVSVVELEEGLPKISRRKQYRKHILSILRKSLDLHNKLEESTWPKLVRHLFYILTAILILAAITVMYESYPTLTSQLLIQDRIYHSLLLHIIRILSPPRLPDNGLSKIVAAWVEPGSTPTWLPNFSRDIMPKPIHSHNDYWRRVPLFEALSLGVTGVEADCHLLNGVLLVGHTEKSLDPKRTLNSLYLDPLTTILENQNANSTIIKGVWDTNPEQRIVLMTDLKTEGFSTLEAVQEQLHPFREKGWLTYWNGTAIVPGPIIHVGTGNTPFEAILNSTYSNTTYRDVFFDAPLDALTPSYNISNSYYASTSMSHIFPHIPHGGLSKAKLAVMKVQIEVAKELGLVSRYWNTPSWPVTKRMSVWKQLVDLDVGMLNVDEILEAARWNWKWCGVLGLNLC